MTAPHDAAASAPHRPRVTAARLAAYLGAWGIAGVLSTVALLWLFIALADEIPEHSWLVRLDTAVGAWLEAHGTELGERVFLVITQLGAPILVASVIAAVIWLAWHRERRDAIALGIVSAVAPLISTVLKLIFHRGRPDTALEFISRKSWSFPSGHALSSMACYGFLAVLLLDGMESRRQRILVIAGAALLIGIIGFSRLYLGVHFLSDVVGGWMAGAAWLIVSTLGYRHIRGHMVEG